MILCIHLQTKPTKTSINSSQTLETDHSNTKLYVVRKRGSIAKVKDGVEWNESRQTPTMLKPYDKQSRKAHPGPQGKKEKEEEDVATSSYTLKAHVIASSPNKSCEWVTGTSTTPPPPRKAKLHRRLLRIKRLAWGWRMNVMDGNGMERSGATLNTSRLACPLPQQLPSLGHLLSTYQQSTFTNLIGYFGTHLAPRHMGLLANQTMWMEEGSHLTWRPQHPTHSCYTYKLKLASKGFCCDIAFKSHRRIVDATAKVVVWWCRSSSKCHAF